jgi:predicted RNA-binding Zn-ribbon protein involved in translation (DUF1610 family)
MTEDVLHVPVQPEPPAEEGVADDARAVPVPLPVQLTVDVTCPSCGRMARIDAARRDAADFCATCDFPLFWAVERVPLPGGQAVGDSGLRRLPGTVGRAALASLACPVCTEPNAPSAVHCVRCGNELRPRPVVVAAPAPPPPVVVQEPEPRRVWWPYVLAGFVVVTILAGLAVLLFA